MSFVRFMSTPTGRALRVAGGLGLLYAGTRAARRRPALAAFGMLPLATGALNICPVTVAQRALGRPACSAS